MTTDGHSEVSGRTAPPSPDRGQHGRLPGSGTDRAGTTEITEAIETRIRAFLDDQAQTLHTLLGDVAGVAVTFVVDGSPKTIGASTQLALDVDLIQFTIGDGPCLHALRTGVGMYVPDLPDDPRWPDYGPQAGERGAKSCLSLPVLVDGRVVAVVKVYSSTVDGLDEEQQSLAATAPSIVRGGVSLAQALTVTSQELEDRVQAMQTRRPIDMAIGIMMERTRCDPATAFEILKRYSQTQNVKLNKIANRLVASIAADSPSAPFGLRAQPLDH